MEIILIAIAVFVFAVVVVPLVKSVKMVRQQTEVIVERLGKYNRTLKPGLNMMIPYVDSVREKLDMRERVVSFTPQPVITSDNLVVSIDTVLYYRVIDPVRATYEIASYLQGIEQLTVTTLRNVIGSLDLERALTSRDEINRHLSSVLDETTGRWGIKVQRVEIKAIEPPPSIRDSMEKQMRAERDRRAAILHAEGLKQSQILTAEGDKQAAVLRAEGERQARILSAEGQAKATRTIVEAIHAANPDSTVMAYQYLQALPQIAAGNANKVWILPVELTRALEGIGGALGGLSGMSTEDRETLVRANAATSSAEADVAEARRAAEEASAAAAAAAAAAVAEVSGAPSRPELATSYEAGDRELPTSAGNGQPALRD